LFSDPNFVHSDPNFAGLPEAFWKWHHKKYKRRGDPDATQEEAEEAYEEWCGLGKPGPDDLPLKLSSISD
jgi:hypothetical protein